MTNRTGTRGVFRRTTRIFVFSGVVLAICVAIVLLGAARSRRAEADRLAALLKLRGGMVVAEIGAGTGWLTVAVAKRVGPSGRIYSTELSAARLEAIRQTVAKAGLTNVSVVEAAGRATNLPPGCCEAIFMRRVYHHLSDPSAIAASIHEALTPGGRLVIIEFERDGLVGMATRMGIERNRLVDQVTDAGFKVVTIEKWPGWDHYVVVFEKSES